MQFRLLTVAFGAALFGGLVATAVHPVAAQLTQAQARLAVVPWTLHVHPRHPNRHLLAVGRQSLRRRGAGFCANRNLRVAQVKGSRVARE